MQISEKMVHAALIVGHHFLEQLALVVQTE